MSASASSGARQDDRRRSGPEWVAFGVSCAILLAFVGLLAVHAGDDDPAAPVAEISSISPAGDRHLVRVQVTNRGDLAAANVEVTASLVVDGATSDGSQTIDFLAGGASENLVFVFADDPATGDLTVEVASFAEP